MTLSRTRALTGSLAVLAVSLSTGTIGAQQSTGKIQTTIKDGTAVNWNTYGSASEVYLNGGPQNLKASGLPNGNYYFQVTDPSGKNLLSTDNAACRVLTVAGGRVAGAAAGRPLGCPAHGGVFNPANGSTTVQLAPFSATPNAGGEYKAWLVSTSKATVGADLKSLAFGNADSKTDNFKVTEDATPQGSCQPSSSLSVLVTGTNVVSYVPKGSWLGGGAGVAVAPIEGTVVPTAIAPAIADVVNSCASNPLTGQTVCTTNTNKLYVINSTGGGATSTALAPLTTAGTGLISFSGGSCTNCGVAMDAVHNKAVIGLSLAGVGGYQFLNLGATPALEPAFPSLSPLISEDPLIDPIRNFVLSAAENNKYEIVDVATSTTPKFFENPVAVSGVVLDSSGEDCSTGIALAPAEFSNPSRVFIANLSSTSASFVPGTPGTWSAPSQVKTLTGSSLAAGASALVVAQGTHIGAVSGEFGGNALTAIQLPAAVDTTAAVPDISAWMTCNIPTFNNGFDPHTITAYQSPNDGHAIALLRNDVANKLARVDLTQMLTLPETSPGSHVCSGGTIPLIMVSFIAVP